MLQHKSALSLAALVVAQTWIPQQQACDSRRDPLNNAEIIEQFTTQDGVRLGVQLVASNLQVPWSMAFAPDGRLFFTERTGRVRIIQNGELLAQPAFTFNDVASSSESGVLGLALHPNFSQNHLAYVAYSALRGGVIVNRVVRFREVNNTFAEAAVLLDNIPSAGVHAGSRIRFGPDGKLYVSTGDAGNPDLSQALSSLAGKILRLNEDGTTPADNPFGSPVWTWGHRHPQGIDWNPVTEDMWATEHGHVGNDELNLIRKGLNYGWPVIQGDQSRPDMERPVLFYTPSVAPSGLSFYRSLRIPRLRNNIFFATLRGMHINRVVLDPANWTRVVSSERLLENRFGRIRDVITGPDGALYFSTSNRDGRATPIASDDRIARIVPVQ